MIFRRVKIRLWYVVAFSVLMWSIISWASFRAGQAVGHLDNLHHLEGVYRETGRIRQAILRCDEVWKYNKEEGKL